jgi:hypothetical protein
MTTNSIDGALPPHVCNPDAVECTCTTCGYILRISCPNCRAATQPAAHGGKIKRTDQVTALLVDAVINASVAEDTAYAARTLCENGVPFDVALRVLTRPWSRRRYPVTLAGASSLCAPDAGAAGTHMHPAAVDACP